MISLMSSDVSNLLTWSDSGTIKYIIKPKVLFVQGECVSQQRSIYNYTSDIFIRKFIDYIKSIMLTILSFDNFLI